MMRTKTIIANWKMHKTLAQVQEWKKEWTLKSESIKNSKVHIGICPSNIYLPELLTLRNEQLKIGAQNSYYSHEGAFTGETSAYMLKSLGVDYVILGHSERRRYFKEQDTLILEKLNDALYCGLTPILCVGETQEQREKHLHYELVKEQLSILTQCYDAQKIGQIIIAYEPVWAIGTGLNATPEQAQEMHLFIRNYLNEHFGAVSEEMTLLYGGSCKPDNALELFQQKDIDGALVGGASLKVDDFLALIDCASKSQN